VTIDKTDPISKSKYLTHGQLISYAKQLAHLHKIGSFDNRYYPIILSRLRQDSLTLRRIYDVFSASFLQAKYTLPSSAEWLLDNYYIISQQIQSIESDLSLGFYKELEKLLVGDHTGYPRVYSLASKYLEHSDNRVDFESLTDFIHSYQSVSPLTSAELWALPIMFRLILIENLSHLVKDSEANFLKRKKAIDWVDSFTKSNKATTKGLTELANLFKDKNKLDSAYLIWLLRSLRDKDHVTGAIHTLEQYIEQEDINIEEIVKVENQERANNRVSIGNAVNGLRLISGINWIIFFEKVSLLERILEQDPSHVYSNMDFHSKDTYRHVIEHLSKFSFYNEQEVARRAIKLASNAQKGTKQNHVGYYLVDQGLSTLEQSISYKPGVIRQLLDYIKLFPNLFYIGIFLLLTTLGVSGFSIFLSSHGISPIWALLGLVPFSVPALSIVNKLVTHFYPPSSPPRLELKHGIPDHLKTVVVIPCLITSSSEVERLTKILERRYLANKEDNIHFALLTDFPDAQEKHLPGETELLEELVSSVSSLQNKFDHDNTDIFYVFHRDRLFNSHEQRWMGWERKRGKLEEFNALIMGRDDTGFQCLFGNLDQIRSAKYAITLDVDTQLPLDSAIKMIGAMAHPLNKPEIDQHTNSVIRGYGIIQPRVGIHAPSAAKSFFTRVFSSEGGLDPYHSVVSNVYQDLFGSSVYLGKGIYDITVFHTCLHNRFPENTLLSHDLLEGSYLRVGLASDIEIMEDFPGSYSSFSSRQHRWIRGDWQILKWLLDGNLSLQSKWRIFDNLRRSLVEPSGFVFLLFGMLALPQMTLTWILFALCIVYFPLVEKFISILMSKTPGEGWNFLSVLREELQVLVSRSFLTVSFMAYEPIRNIDAIIAAIYRTTFHASGTLEWVSHAVEERSGVRMRTMYPATLLSVLILLYWFVFSQTSSIAPILLTITWLISPLFSHLTGQPEKQSVQHISESDKDKLLSDALRIWRYFDEFSQVENNYLPPDNYQVSPVPVLAKRTSPTNIGLGLLSVVSAHDFGFSSREQLFRYLENAITTIERLEKYRGHLFNWYKTDTLEALQPLYVSTVDSGNLVTSLITLRQSCLDISTRPVGHTLDAQVWQTIKRVWTEDWQRLAENGSESSTKNDTSDKIQSQLSEIINLATDKINSLEISDNLSTQSEILIKIESLEQQVVEFVGQDKLWQVTYWRHDIYRRLNTSTSQSTISTDLWHHLISRINKLVDDVDFGFLYNIERKVFSIGFNVNDNRSDDSFYNLLASEARLASFIAVAKGQVPDDHWFILGRPLARVGGKTVLLSWGGTMFEYIMPLLFLKDLPNTLLWQTSASIVDRQVKYGRSKSIPWGISESGFFAFDFQYNYQYQQFGIPELSLKTELRGNLVIAPYATFLALPLRPLDAVRNLQNMTKLGLEGTYGYYEAADFTPSRIPKKETFGLVKSFMAHHQGMSMISLNNYLNDNLMQNRFHADPLVIRAESLLDELIPVHIPKIELPEEVQKRPQPSSASTSDHVFSGKPDIVRTSILSNSEYSVIVSNTGVGASICKGLDITRSSLDLSENNSGWFCFIKDTSTSKVWSSTYQPFLKEPDSYSVTLSPFKAEFARVDDDIETKTRVYVAVDKNIEIREITLTNRNKDTKTIELTDYAEIVGLPHREDSSHIAFGKLFIESEYDQIRQSLAFKRRHRQEHKDDLWIFHSAIGDGKKISITDYETDRKVFIGRGKTILNASAFSKSLSRSTGATLDPIMSLRTRIKLNNNQTKKLHFVTLVADSKEQGQNMIDRFADPGEIDRILRLSEIHSHIELRHLGIGANDAKLFQKLGSKIFFPDRHYRAQGDLIAQNKKGQSGLYAFGISGDYPIVLVKIKEKEGLKIVRQALLAHEFLRLKKFEFDLLILNEEKVTYQSNLKESIQTLIDTSLSRPLIDKPGGIFVRESAFIGTEDKILLEASARVILDSQWGSLEDNLELIPKKVFKPNNYNIERPIPRSSSDTKIISKMSSSINKQGNEYVIHTQGGKTSPLPWSNVISNPRFGTLVTSGGLGYTWAENSQLNRISTWSNDPVSEKPGEALYLRDDHGWWSATSLPHTTDHKYTIKHGWGYTKYQCKNAHITTDTTVWVDKVDPVKLVLVNLTNNSQARKLIKPIYYAELVLSDNRETKQFHIVSAQDPATGALTASNSFNENFRNHVTFLQCTQDTSFSGDRNEFIGLGGAWNKPIYMTQEDSRLSGTVGAGLDPAFIMETEVTLEPGEEKQLAFIIGQGTDVQEYYLLAQKYKDLKNIEASLADSIQAYAGRLSTIQIHTPNKNLDILTNGWLNYQTLSGRYWGRTGFFQSGGAFGFRDQLQDVLSLIYQDPALVRQHILYAASHQFIQGDVMHWWHPKTTKGVRTRISDDFLWLPYTVESYISITQDTDILNEKISFLDFAPLADGENEHYDEALVTREKSSLYTHCLRALENGMKTGHHGLPLIGSGDWNDGMNSVGDQGKGESIWLAWFQFQVYSSFSKLAKKVGDVQNATKYTKYANKLKEAVEKHGWDGEWYRRAYFDTGEPLGSSQNTECRIDSISQTWSVISGGADKDRSTQAIASVEKHLVKQKDQIILLSTPPFVSSEPYPGYINGYLPGIRENGGQYTHAAAWLPLAYTKLGNGDRAVELLDMLNPFNHTDTKVKVKKYQGEPYVMAGDVYNHPQHVGRAGWSWYTGSPSWIYKTIIENIIGLTLSGSHLTFKPCIPKDWTEFQVIYHFQDTTYDIKFKNPNHHSTGVTSMLLDGQDQPDKTINLVNDLQTHLVEITL
jgi:cyclic beta-1,2-glucan synthetase